MSLRLGSWIQGWSVAAIVAVGGGAPLLADEQAPHPNPIVAQSAPVPAPDKSGYTLFNPTPAALMRGFNTNRPSVTEGPYTVDAGHFQVELSLAEFTHDADHGLRTDQFSVLPSDIRLGILNNLELDLMFDPYLNVLVHGRSRSHRDSEFGDTEVRAALNLWGNDGGVTAGGILAFGRFPTGTDGLSNHHVEGGIILPLAIQLPAGFDLGTMAEFDFDRNARNDGYGVDFTHTITLGHDLFEHATAYVEYVGIAPISTGRTYLAYFDTGMTYALSENVQIDAGINIGLSSRADNFTLFAGMSFRL